MKIKQLSVAELKTRFDKKEIFFLVDVREKNEFEIARIPNSKLIPLSEFSKRVLEELKPEMDLVLHCHHGGRSTRACEYLVSMGFKNVANLTGGIDAWSVEIDGKVPRY